MLDVMAVIIWALLKRGINSINLTTENPHIIRSAISHQLKIHNFIQQIKNLLGFTRSTQPTFLGMTTKNLIAVFINLFCFCSLLL